ncbi:tetratricopeptide repeat protein [Thioalkalivibrio sulfidiphilus]|uniref:tetratricopeptide repeat protein n=1 Tax=Thioalkalivibrio sulfidiphilus TaxID=1033854 RepID=UPI000380797E|nr:tetratricopeptide repeat protein [Thioalkalivibrio sulfidiphilus]
MQRFLRPVPALVAVMLLAACAPPQATRPTAGEPGLVEEGVAAPLPAPDARPAIARDPAPADSRATGSDAVVALMGEADRQLVAGNPDAAAATLERALRIDARDPRLWQRLAVVRLQQGQPAQAEAMAVRSNGLARGDRALMARNWRIIAEARRMAGNAAGAREADARANQLSGEPG